MNYRRGRHRDQRDVVKDIAIPIKVRLFEAGKKGLSRVVAASVPFFADSRPGGESVANLPFDVGVPRVDQQNACFAA